MSKRTITILRYVFFALIIGVLAMNLHQPADCNKSVNTVTKQTMASVNTKSLEQQNNQEIKRFLQLDASMYDGIVYYKDSDTMKADELLIVKFKDHSQAEDFNDKMQTRIDSQKKIFAGYAPKEADKLDAAVVDVRANYALYAVSKNADTFDQQFRAALK
ncbi:DUF4358 domain-containing protein [Catenisphaera adipataccumulans]|uniref:DUF4358 domain-containing protein n=1 Tax=Catenisphaera adipataccumulans TaxID=700500 RepID=A0A7W8FVJ2_9FIRM|nr:DUF4358 domain-containing protein [Catenisphaera adipataccumulans]MBB5183203.1 hypothetical protein [Catenisphaera adipataccumulans]